MAGLPDDPLIQCGYGWFSTRHVQKLIGMPEPFLSACLIHDQRYGDRKGKRREWDRELLRNMLEASISTWDRARAYLFYGTVRLLGGPVWRGE